jgi:hypothetical protein
MLLNNKLIQLILSLLKRVITGLLLSVFSLEMTQSYLLVIGVYGWRNVCACVFVCEAQRMRITCIVCRTGHFYTVKATNAGNLFEGLSS